MNEQQHLLTDETINHIALDAQWSGDIGDVVFTRDDMRHVYDQAIKDVITVLHGWDCCWGTLRYPVHDDLDDDIGVAVMRALHQQHSKAMRPQQQQEEQ